MKFTNNEAVVLLAALDTYVDACRGRAEDAEAIGEESKHWRHCEEVARSLYGRVASRLDDEISEET